MLGRSQAVRQWILIPPRGGSIPPAPTITSSKDIQEHPKIMEKREFSLILSSIVVHRNLLKATHKRGNNGGVTASRF